MEADIDHIHYVISAPVNINLSEFIRNFKSYISRQCYLDPIVSKELRKFYWYRNYLFHSGAFITSVGVNLDIVKNYVKNQGV